MNIEYMLWFGSGFLGAFILNRNPSKLVFSRSFQGTMIRTVLSLVVLVSVLSGPLLLVLALLLPSKKLCPSCYSAVLQTENICPYCSAYVPDLQPEAKTPKEELTESKLSHFSPEVQAAVNKGYKVVSGGSLFFLVGIIMTSLILGVFVLKESAAGTTVVCIGLPLGFISAWLWWSYSVPRWRQWALKQPGVNPDELQKAAEVATLLWPKGHVLEKTEFRIREK